MVSVKGSSVARGRTIEYLVAGRCNGRVMPSSFRSYDLVTEAGAAIEVKSSLWRTGSKCYQFQRCIKGTYDWLVCVGLPDREKTKLTLAACDLYLFHWTDMIDKHVNINISTDMRKAHSFAATYEDIEALRLQRRERKDDSYIDEIERIRRTMNKELDALTDRLSCG